MSTAAVPLYGVDLEDPEVLALLRRLFYCRFGLGLQACGLEPEDVMQKICVSILVRNAGRNPYDPRRASLSTYLSLVIQSVVFNALDGRRRAALRGWTLGADQDVVLDRRAATRSPW